jgi:hypothetical protein
VPRKTFGPKKDEVTGDWREFCNKSFMICTSHHAVCYSGDQIKKNKMVCACGTCGG